MRYGASRLAQSLIVLWALVTVVFAIGRMTGDPVAALLPETADETQRSALRTSLGLDRPILEQYVTYVSGLAGLDFGKSYRSGLPVAALLSQRLPNSLVLIFCAASYAVLLAVPLGVLGAIRADTWLDRTALMLAVLGQAIPQFWLGIVLILAFAVTLHWLPTSGSGGLLNLVLPTLTLGSSMVAGLFRLTRSSMLDVLAADYLTTARGKGLSEPHVVFSHALRNALLAPVSFVAIYVGLLIGGTVVVETVFNWPGLGRLAYEATLNRDLPVMQAVVLMSGLGVLISNLAADVVSAVLDPRIRR